MSPDPFDSPVRGVYRLRSIGRGNWLCTIVQLAWRNRPRFWHMFCCVLWGCFHLVGLHYKTKM
jgi:hypothetical protein